MLENPCKPQCGEYQTRQHKTKVHIVYAEALCIFLSMCVSAELNSFEEPGAVVPHAWIYEGAVG